MTTAGLSKRVEELTAAVKAREAGQAEQQGRLLYEVMRSALEDLGIDAEDPAVRAVMGAAIRRIIGEETDEDRAAGQTARESWWQRQRRQSDLNVAARSWELHEQAVRDGAVCAVDRATRERAAQRLADEAAQDAGGRRWRAQHGSAAPGVAHPAPDSDSAVPGLQTEQQRALPPGRDWPIASDPLLGTAREKINQFSQH